MQRVFLILILLIGLTGCWPTQAELSAGLQAQRAVAQQKAAQKEEEFKQVFSEKERQLVESTIRKGLAYPASARFEDWAVVSPENKQGWVVVNATNTYGSRRVLKGYVFQINPDGSVTAEPYVRGM